MNRFFRGFGFLLTAVFIVMCFSIGGFAATDEEVTAAIAGGQEHLFATQQPDGSWHDDRMSRYDFATTCFAVAALLETGVAKTDQHVIDGIDYIKSFVQPGGGIYDPSAGHANYQNGCALIALSLYGDDDPDFRAMVQNAADVALESQNIPANGGVDSDDASYGGWGYSTTAGGGDLSNTQYAVMGLWYASRYLGLAVAGEPWTEALLTYLQRCHGWYDEDNGETWNDQDWVRDPDKNTPCVDGAFSYSPWGTSFYPGGSMTAAGIWCLAMIGQDQNPMVDIAIEWFSCDDNYAWDRNPGSYYDSNPNMSHYYYVYSMGKALTAALGTESQVGEHDWVQDLKDTMVDDLMQTVAGSDPVENYWEGTGTRDGGDVMATGWVLMTLAFADPSTESPEKLLADPGDLDNPIKGLITLKAEGGVTISEAYRINIGEKEDCQLMPVGGLDFTLHNVPKGGSTVLTIEVPEGALDPDNPDSFVNPDGTIKEGLAWLKLEGGSWMGVQDLPIEVDQEANTIKVTLTDGGPEDQDGAQNGEIHIVGAPGTGCTLGAFGLSPGGGGGDCCFINTASLDFPWNLF